MLRGSELPESIKEILRRRLGEQEKPSPAASMFQRMAWYRMNLAARVGRNQRAVTQENKAA